MTPENFDLRRTLDDFITAGFYSVGFSPMLSAPGGRGELQTADLVRMLDGMVDCSRTFERRLVAGERYPFDNMVNAMREINRGSHRPYPCGAGAGYLGVSADGELAACHRFVGDVEGAMGTVAGVDRDRQAHWPGERHVHRQAPCTECWARYLCGGGCHHEMIHRGRPACEYIRGWLEYCLTAYLRLLRQRPDWFGASAGAMTIKPRPSQRIGAGPAGSALAIRRAQLGHDVCVIARSTFQRSHIGDPRAPASGHSSSCLARATRLRRPASGRAASRGGRCSRAPRFGAGGLPCTDC